MSVQFPTAGLGDPTDLVIQFLDVGQGDGIYIEFPAEIGKHSVNMLVDLGSTKNRDVVRPDIIKYFKMNTRFGLPNQTLDYLILTHGDIDHYNLVPYFLNQLGITQIGKCFFGGV